MFSSWKRAPQKTLNASPTTSKKRSIPIPLKDCDNGSSFKNLSSPESSEPSATPTAEFSRVKSSMSIQSLRRLIKPSDAETKPREEPKKEPNSVPTMNPINQDPSNTDKAQSSGSSAAPQAQSNDDQTDTSIPEASHQNSDGWIWSMFKTDKQPKVDEPTNKTGRAWAFWAKDSDSANNSEDKESGRLAVSGTETEHDPSKAVLEIPQAKRRKNSKPSIVVPQFSTIPWASRTSRLANFLWSSVSTNSYRHMVLQSPVKPKRAVVIGVHGYFPARMTRKILGEPTGTSIKFANEAESRLQNWFSDRFPGESIKIDKIALEGEGKIDRRVDKLYGLLLNFESLLKEADFVFFAVHSQGAVVTVNIVARLLEQQMLNHKQRVTILSMAGSLLGPMPGMDQTLVMKAITRIEHDSLIELFQLQDVESRLSKSVQASLDTVLSAGVKLALVGSADDQLIPLYSALAINVQHPNLFRATYIDGDDVMPDVISPLLQLASQQLNSGHTDHGVVSELSSILAGALTSKGHSKLYSSDNVYDLGIQVALETAFCAGAHPHFDQDFRIPKPTGNPFLLPWAANALVSDSRKSKHLMPVVKDLLLQFNEWRPETKQMKDLKLRLAGISRLSKL